MAAPGSYQPREIGPTITGSAAGPGVAGSWVAEMSDTTLVLPDGCVDIMWAPGRTPWIAGPDTFSKPGALPIGSQAVGVRLLPGAAHALTRQSVTEFVDRRVDLDAVLGTTTARHMTARLDHAHVEAAGRTLAGLISSHFDPTWQPDPAVEAEIVQLRRGRPHVESALGPRQLRRRFTRSMGYGPKFFERLCRLDRFLEQMATTQALSLAQAATRAGYYDQAHLCRETQALTGRTPQVLAGAGRCPRP